MAEDAAANVPDPGTPPDPEPDPTETPSGEPVADPTETPSGEPAAEPEPEPDEPESYRKALDKHKGDRGKLGDHYFETQTQNAELTRRLQKADDERETLLEAVRRGTADPEPAGEATPPPELSEFDTQIEALQTHAKDVQAATDSTIDAFNDLKVDLRMAERELADADPIDQKAMKTSIAAMKREMKLLESNYRTQEQVKHSAERDLARLERERDDVEERLESDRANQGHAEERRQEQTDEYTSWVGSTIEESLKDAGVPEVKVKYAAKTVWAQLAYHLMSTPAKPLSDQAARKEHAQFIEDEVSQYINEHGIQKAKDFKSESERKRSTARRPAARPAAPVSRQPQKPESADPFKGASKRFGDALKRRVQQAG